MTPGNTRATIVIEPVTRYVQWTQQRAQLLSRQTSVIKTHIEAYKLP